MKFCYIKTLKINFFRTKFSRTTVATTYPIIRQTRHSYIITASYSKDFFIITIIPILDHLSHFSYIITSKYCFRNKHTELCLLLRQSDADKHSKSLSKSMVAILKKANYKLDYLVSCDLTYMTQKR